MNKILKARIIQLFGSQFEFARAVGEHEATVSRVIRGRRDLSLEERMRWAIALDCDDPQDIFKTQKE